MTQYRIRIYTDRRYNGYFWEIERFNNTFINKKEKGYWSRVTRGGYAFTRWGADLAAKRAARRYLRYQPFEKIKELK